MKTVLSTKILTLPQKELLLNSGIAFVEYAALKIEFPEVDIPLDFENFIFTSQNGVKAFLKVQDSKRLNVNAQVINCFCVGDKTKKLLKENGFSVIESANSAVELSEILIKKYGAKKFIYISGNLRRNDLPKLLSENNVWFQEIEGYRTHLLKKEFQRSFDGILFFSPSGIKSFLLANECPEIPFFCIGQTTAEEAKKHTDQIIIANHPTTENVLVQVIKYFKQHD